MRTAVNATVQRTIQHAPIASWLGLSASMVDGRTVYRLAFDEKHIGNPAIRALHGGAIAAFLELVAQCALIEKLDSDAAIKTINADINYLASSRAQDMEGDASILRLGRRIAFVEAAGWQQSKDRPVARATFRMRVGSEN